MLRKRRKETCAPATSPSHNSCGRQGLYTPISSEKSELRLLDLEPGADYESVIHCKLRVTSLVAIAQEMRTKGLDPSYKALSYTWGDALVVKDIAVNDRIIGMTANLEAFLRLQREPQEAVTLWVDAVCINQDGALEKCVL
jgi:hypothetical protein